jgi:hypothetical protein
VAFQVLALLQGDADVGLMHLKTSLWDTCATEAVLRAAGGVLTDLHGCPIEHSAGSPTLNRLGVLASTAALPATGPHHRTHGELCAALRASGCLLPLTAGDGLVSREAEEIPQATDVARTISGQPITAKLLSQWVCNRTMRKGWGNGLLRETRPGDPPHPLRIQSFSGSCDTINLQGPRDRLL